MTDSGPQRRTQTCLGVVSDDLRARLDRFKLVQGARRAGYPDVRCWHSQPEIAQPVFPAVPLQRAGVYRGDEHFGYSHHPLITRFGEVFVASWSNGWRHEDHPGQQIHCSWSRDLRHWEPWRVVVATDPESSANVRTNSGLCAFDGRLFLFVGVCENVGNQTLATGSMQFRRMWIDLYVTDDLVRWQAHERLIEHAYVFEGPRPTRAGDQLCAGINTEQWDENLVLVWPRGRPLTAAPDPVRIPRTPDVRPEQGTWYERDDGGLWMWLRDGALSTRLALSLSQDQGRTWSVPLLTDFRNTYSRAHAGRMNDGRFYLVGNNYDQFLDRQALQLALSDDGRTFDRMVTLLDAPTSRRLAGFHKEDGYHYPNCVVDGDRLVVIYSVNKEDIEVVSIDTAALA